MSSKTKHVNFDRGTKSEKKSHRSSRDSGIGSSSASDRASLGETHPHQSPPFSSSEIRSQQHILSAVQEALDAANARVRGLEAEKAALNDALARSHKENRVLKREKKDLHDRVEGLEDRLEDVEKINEKLRRASPPRSPTTKRIESQRPQTVERRGSQYERTPMAPNAPPNPFTPLHSRPDLTYASPAQVSYPPPSNYAPPPAPNYAVSQPKRHSQQQVPNDGRYHLTPV